MVPPPAKETPLTAHHYSTRRDATLALAFRRQPRFFDAHLQLGLVLRPWPRTALAGPKALLLNILRAAEGAGEWDGSNVRRRLKLRFADCRNVCKSEVRACDS